MTDPETPPQDTEPGTIPVPTDPVARAEPDATAPGRRRSHRRAAFAVAFVLGLLVVLGGTGAGLAAWDSGYQDRILPGVHVGSVDLSGLDRTQATRALTAAFRFQEGQLILRTPNGDITIPYAAFSRRADVGALVDTALLAGRNGDTAARAAGEVRQALLGTTIEPRVTLDQRALATAIAGLLRPLNVAPKDAVVAKGKTGPIITPGANGRRVDPAPVVAAALDVVGSTHAPTEIVIPVTTTVVPPAAGVATAQAAVDRAQAMATDIVVRYGKKSWKIRAATVRTWITFAAPGDGSITPVLDPALVARALVNVRKGVATPAQSAIYLRNKAGRIIGVGAGANGRKLDTETTIGLIAAELGTRADGTAPTDVKVAIAPVVPKLTTDTAQKTAPLLTKLGTWTTWFPINDHNYFGANIWLPAQIINGTVLKPGQTFDWFRVVGPVTPARGFGPGGVIKGNHTDPTGALGGGMCSSSTTLFNAALRAGLQMGARGNHRYYIYRYPLGLDATVWIMGGATQSMSFTNDTGHPILIRGVKTRSGGTGYVTYELWGVPDGRTVSLGAPVVTNVVTATTNTEYVSTLPHGARNQVEYPSNQMDTAVTRVVRDHNGRILHQEVWRSHYVLWNGLIQVGL